MTVDQQAPTLRRVTNDEFDDIIGSVGTGEDGEGLDETLLSGDGSGISSFDGDAIFIDSLDSGFSSVFRLGELSEFLILHLIDIVDVIADISRFRTEKEHEDKLSDDEDLKDMEYPRPTHIRGDLTTNNGGEGRSGIEDRSDESDSKTTFVDEESITNRCNDQRFESRGGKSLNDTSSKESLISLSGLSDGGSDNHHQGAEKEDWSFPVFSRESADERTDTSGSENIVASENSDVGDGDVEFGGNDDDG